MDENSSTTGPALDAEPADKHIPTSDLLELAEETLSEVRGAGSAALATIEHAILCSACAIVRARAAAESVELQRQQIQLSAEHLASTARAVQESQATSTMRAIDAAFERVGLLPMLRERTRPGENPLIEGLDRFVREFLLLSDVYDVAVRVGLLQPGAPLPAYGSVVGHNMACQFITSTMATGEKLRSLRMLP